MGVEIELIFAVPTAVSAIQVDLSKLSYLGMKLGIGKKFQKLHMHSLCILRGQNWGHFCSTYSGFRDIG